MKRHEFSRFLLMIDFRLRCAALNRRKGFSIIPGVN